MPTRVWDNLSIDFVEGLPLSGPLSFPAHQFSDWFSKFARFIPLKYPFTPLQLAQILFEKIVWLYDIHPMLWLVIGIGSLQINSERSSSIFKEQCCN